MRTLGRGASASRGPGQGACGGGASGPRGQGSGARRAQGRAKGKRPKPPEGTPRGDEQSNLSDPDGRLMRKSKRHEFRQAYNAQAVVDAGGSQLIVGARISNCASDRNELVADIAAVAADLGRPETVLADNGYANGAEVAAHEARGIEALVATAAERRRRRHDFRPAGSGTAVKEAKADWLREMAKKLDSEEGRALYKLRRQTVEPVFLARRPEVNASTQPANAGNRRSSDRLNPILAVSSNLDHAAGRQKPNHQNRKPTPKSDRLLAGATGRLSDW